MWALALVGAAAVALFIRWLRAGQPAWHFLPHEAIRLFVRLWHRAREVEDPLPARGPALVVAKHQSNADPAFLMAVCRRRLRFLQAKEYFDVPILRYLFQFVGCIPVARNGRDTAALRAALRSLQQGDVLCIFPEEDVQAVQSGGARPRSGAALLALRSGAPVFPAFIARAPQTGRVIGDWLLPSRGARVLFGPPVDLSRFYSRPPTRKLLGEVTTELMLQIERLNPVLTQPTSATLSRRSA